MTAAETFPPDFFDVVRQGSGKIRFLPELPGSFITDIPLKNQKRGIDGYVPAWRTAILKKRFCQFFVFFSMRQFQKSCKTKEKNSVKVMREVI